MAQKSEVYTSTFVIRYMRVCSTFLRHPEYAGAKPQSIRACCLLSVCNVQLRFLMRLLLDVGKTISQTTTPYRGMSTISSEQQTTQHFVKCFCAVQGTIC